MWGEAVSQYSVELYQGLAEVQIDNGIESGLTSRADDWETYRKRRNATCIGIGRSRNGRPQQRRFSR
jgi:hypothetical protein